MSSAPLEGVRVVDFSTLLPGPLATLMLARAGARVIRVERPPLGDELRHLAPLVDGISAQFRWLNEGKDSLALDLKDPASLDAAKALIDEADVLVEQFRPGVMNRLGLGYAETSKRNPKLLYCSITGYGAQDPRSLQAGHDLNYQADAGLLEIPAHGPDGRPPLPSALLADIAGGAYPAFMNIVLALCGRDRAGRGCFIDISMNRGLFAFEWLHLIRGVVEETWQKPGQARHSGGSPRYQIYRTRDGRFLALAALEDRFWQNFQEAIGLSIDPAEENSRPEMVQDLIAERLVSRDAQDWLIRFRGRDVCCNLVLSPEEAYRDLAVRRNSPGSRDLEIPLPIVPELQLRHPRAAAPSLGNIPVASRWEVRSDTNAAANAGQGTRN